MCHDKHIAFKRHKHTKFPIARHTACIKCWDSLQQWILYSFSSSLNNEWSLGRNIANITFSLVFQHGSYTFFWAWYGDIKLWREGEKTGGKYRELVDALWILMGSLEAFALGLCMRKRKWLFFCWLPPCQTTEKCRCVLFLSLLVKKKSKFTFNLFALEQK
jgi:hypothetical protein